jgi:isocitrate lyase
MTNEIRPVAPSGCQSHNASPSFRRMRNWRTRKTKLRRWRRQLRQCGHSFDVHIMAAHDMNNFSKGDAVRCPVAQCSCFHSLDFDLTGKP